MCPDLLGHLLTLDGFGKSKSGNLPLPGTISGAQGASQTKRCHQEANTPHPISMQSHFPSNLMVWSSDLAAAFEMVSRPSDGSVQTQVSLLKWSPGRPWSRLPGEAGQGRSHRFAVVTKTILTDSLRIGACDLSHSWAVLNGLSRQSPGLKLTGPKTYSAIT